MIVASLFAVLSGCSNGGSGGSGATGGGDDVTDTQAETFGSTTIISNDFSFPVVAETADGFEVTIPEGLLPDFPARRTLSAGTGNAITFGDPICLCTTCTAGRLVSWLSLPMSSMKQ